MTERERAEDVHDHKRTDGGPDSAVAPFPPERPADDQRPVSQKEGEARATAAALAGEHGTDGPPQYVDAPEPHGHNAGDYVIPGEGSKGSGAKATTDREKVADQKAVDKDKADDDADAKAKAKTKADADAKVKADADAKTKADTDAKDSWRDKGSAASR